MAVQYPTINGNIYSYASIRLTLNDQRYIGVTSINYGDKVSPSKVRGAAQAPLGETAGDLEGACDFEMLEPDARAFMADIGSPLTATRFNIAVEYAEDGLDTYVDTIKSVRIIEAAKSMSQGTEGLKIKFTCSVLQPIDYNGIQLAASIDTSGTAGI